MSGFCAIDSNSESMRFGIKSKPCKIKMMGFALAILASLAGLILTGVVSAGLLNSGAISSLNQANALLMLGAGTSGWLVLLIFGIVGCIKNSVNKQVIGSETRI